MSFTFELRRFRAAYSRNQCLMDNVTDHKQMRTGQKCCNIGADSIAKHGIHPQSHKEIVGRVHAEHHEIALSEVDDPHHAKDER